MTCSVEGCDAQLHALGLCKRHYRRAKVGIPLEGKRVLWMPDQDAVLTEHYRAQGPARLALSGLLPGKSAKAIKCRATTLGLQVKRGRPSEAPECPLTGVMVGAALRMWRGPVDVGLVGWRIAA